VQVVTFEDIADFASLGVVFSVSIGKPSHVLLLLLLCRGKVIPAVRAGISRGTWHDSAKVRSSQALFYFTFVLYLENKAPGETTIKHI